MTIKWHICLYKQCVCQEKKAYHQKEYLVLTNNIALTTNANRPIALGRFYKFSFNENNDYPLSML